MHTVVDGLKGFSGREAVIRPFAFAPEGRIIIYTTNAIESLNASVGKAVRKKAHFPSDQAAMKLIWLALRRITEIWRKPPSRGMLPRRNCSAVIVCWLWLTKRHYATHHQLQIRRARPRGLATPRGSWSFASTRCPNVAYRDWMSGPGLRGLACTAKRIHRSLKQLVLT